MNTPIIIEQGGVRIIDRERAVIIGTMGPQGPSQDLSGYLTIAGAAAVATSGDYNDLLNLPTLGTAAARDIGQAAGNVLEVDASGSSGVTGDFTAGGGLIGETLTLSGSDITANGVSYTFGIGGILAVTAVEKSANFTAEKDAVYTVTASCTVTDPTPSQAASYTVIVRNGTATIGGTGYATAGTVIRRIYHSGAWASYPYFTTASVPALASDLSSLNASNLTSGTVALARLVNTQTVGNADATISAGTRDVLLTAAITAPRTYTLPAASGYPAGARITFVDVANTITTTNTVTLARAGSDTINGGTSIVLSTAGASPLLISDGSSKWNLDIRGVARGGTGSTSLTANNVLLGNGTNPLQTVAPGTSGNVLTSNGTTWTSAAPTGGGVPTSRTISTTAPLTGGGDLSADRTLAISTATTSTAGVVPNLGGAIPVGAFSVAQAVGASRCVWPFTSTVWGQAVTGTGGTSRTDSSMYALTGTTTSSTALIRSQGQYAMAWTRLVALNSTTAFLTDYSRTLVWMFSVAISAHPVNGTVRISWGKSSGDGIGALARHGWEIVLTGSGGATVTLGAHNGTTLATATVSAASGFTGWTPHPVVVILRGGSMYFYYGDDALTLDTPTATLAGAPTATTGTLNQPFFQLEVSNGASASDCQAQLYQLSTMILK